MSFVRKTVAGPVMMVIAAVLWSIDVFGNEVPLGLLASKYFGSLPEVMADSVNPITKEKVALGRILFFEPRISRDGTVSCSRCHLPQMFGTDGLPLAIGNICKINPRNAPTILNAAAQFSQHWIGNRTSVEDQARQALIGPPSFGMPSYDSAMAVLRSIPGYGPLFKAAFPKDSAPLTAEHFAMAVGAYERTLVTPAPFDAFVKGDTAALDAVQKAGLREFVAVGCSSCHGGTLFGGQSYQKFGVAQAYWTLTKSKTHDSGRFAVTGKEADRYYFKVPILRNVAMTAPYFHDGSVAGLGQAVEAMAKSQLGIALTQKQENKILVFLHTLTGKLPESFTTIPVIPVSGKMEP